MQNKAINKTILIIDDDAELAATLKAVLEAKHYAVVLAADSEEGMARAHAHPPDLIILDVMMRTTGEGIAAARRFKDDGALKAVPIIMMTAVREETGFSFDPAKDGEFLPVEVFLEKPVDPRQLLKEVEKLLK